MYGIRRQAVWIGYDLPLLMKAGVNVQKPWVRIQYQRYVGFRMQLIRCGEFLGTISNGVLRADSTVRQVVEEQSEATQATSAQLPNGIIGPPISAGTEN